MFITNLISKITNFRVKIGDKLNTLKSQIGQLNLLTTNDKTSLVGAVNEVNSLLPTVEEFTNTLKKDESNTVTENFEITNGTSKIKFEDSFAISAELVGESEISLGSDDGFAVYYSHNGAGDFSAGLFGIEGNVTGTGHWGLYANSNGISKMKMPITGITERVLTTGAKVGATTYYANTQGVIELPEYSFAANSRNKTKFENESAFGSYNKIYNQIAVTEGIIPDDLRFSIGIGNADNNRKNALSVFKNGEAWFDELTPSKIDNSKSNKVAVTKEYLDMRVPKPPATGTHVLKSVNGVVSWVAE